MKKSSKWMLIFSLVSLFMLASWGGAGEKTSKAKLLHFGNMGGLLPTLKQSDLPDHESEAAELIFKLCGQCHNSPGPGLHTVKEWETVFWRMYWRMHMMNAQFDHFMVPTFGEGELMFMYLKQNAMRPATLNKVDMEQPGAKEYVTYCSQCHQLPDPQMHTKGEWPKVTARMAKHMGSMAKNLADQATLTTINGYLQANAR
ncbi:MAG: hypothetical protein G8345_04925 [Magnetococcales bacterium]|nr:hypothetical protein [Magnetococcales bacterium]NGZ26214.1 hypothetical protein [Magnetococcales bacterium]